MKIVPSKAASTTAICVLGTLLGRAALAARPLAERTEPGRTSIAKARRDGRVLEIATGTGTGRCWSSGEVLVCEDQERSVRATLEDGCLEATGGAHCEILEPSTPGTDNPPIVVPAAGSGIDVECQKGSKSGNIYTISDGDGSGGCEYVLDVDKKVIGGTCTKNGASCTAVNCDRGCESSGSGCECHHKSARHKVQSAQ